MEFIQNLIKAPQENQEGRQARKAVLEYPINFIPTSNEIHSILQAIDEGADTQQGILHLLGFKPLPEVEENEDYQRWLEEELGFRQRPTR